MRRDEAREPLVLLGLAGGGMALWVVWLRASYGLPSLLEGAIWVLGALASVALGRWGGRRYRPSRRSAVVVWLLLVLSYIALWFWSPLQH